MESTPFVFKDELKYLISERIDKPLFLKLAIYDFKTNKKISSFGKGLGLASAIVENNKLYIFATKNWFEYGKSEIYMLETTDLKKFSKPILIFKAREKQKLFNTSVTKNIKKANFIMAVETDEQGLTTFSIRFLESTDLKSWRYWPDRVFAPNSYVACPTIKYINDYYYMWFTNEYYFDPNCTTCKLWVGRITKSKDLVSWDTSPKQFLIPDQKDEGINNSDIDLTEFKNKVYIFYAIGDQQSWAAMKYAVYNSSLRDLVDNFF